MEKYITKNSIKYELRGEQYYPILEIYEQANYEIGKYGHLHLDFIKKHRRGTYTTLLTEGCLNEHLHSIDEQAHEQIDLHIAQMAKQAAVKIDRQIGGTDTQMPASQPRQVSNRHRKSPQSRNLSRTRARYARVVRVA